MKYFSIAIMVMLLSACERSTQEDTANYALPSGLKDCSIYKMHKGGLNPTLVVVRCPKSDTTTTHSCGKNCITSNSVIEE